MTATNPGLQRAEDPELYFEVVPGREAFAVVHQASSAVFRDGLGCLDATELAERLTEQAHRAFGY